MFRKLEPPSRESGCMPMQDGAVDPGWVPWLGPRAPCWCAPVPARSPGHPGPRTPALWPPPSVMRSPGLVTAAASRYEPARPPGPVGGTSTGSIHAETSPRSRSGAHPRGKWSTGLAGETIDRHAGHRVGTTPRGRLLAWPYPVATERERSHRHDPGYRALFSPNGGPGLAGSASIPDGGARRRVQDPERDARHQGRRLVHRLAAHTSTSQTPLATNPDT